MKLIGLAVLFVVAAVVAGTAMSAAAVGRMRQPASVQTPSTGTSMYSKSGFDVTHLSQKRIEELAAKLTPDEAKVILKKGTEPAFCGNLVDNHKDGVYVCRLCELPLFSSDAKFDSGTGWPSFFQPVDNDHIHYETDEAYGMKRTEIMCRRCGAHLGHVFDDGPKPSGLRFCLNSVSLVFFEKGKELPAAARPMKTEIAYFAGGCFWGVEDRFQQVPGVAEVISGYMGGKTKNPTYGEVCSHETGHAETVMVVYDPAKVTYGKLLEWFFKFHDPTQLDRQGPDIGDSYRSAIFAADKKQLDEAKAFLEAQQKTERFKGRKIVTQLQSIEQSGRFYPAEDYHQDYHRKHGGSCPLPRE